VTLFTPDYLFTGGSDLSFQEMRMYIVLLRHLCVSHICISKAFSGGYIFK
jgi:hypothetical protein